MSPTPAAAPVPTRTGLARIGWAFVYSMQGLLAALRHEAAFRQELAGAAVLIPVAFWLPATALQTALLVACVLLVLMVELLNSAVEAAIDRQSAEVDALAGRAKDLSSAAVFVSLLNCVVVWVLVLLEVLG